MRGLFIFLMVLNMVYAAQDTHSYSQYIALNIGDEKAQDMHNTFKALGFESSVVSPITLPRIEEALLNFKLKLESYENTLGILYYSGEILDASEHVINIYQDYYLAPDNIFNLEPSIRYRNALPIKEIINVMHTSHNESDNLILLDADFSQGIKKDLYQQDHFKNTLLIFSKNQDLKDKLKQHISQTSTFDNFINTIQATVIGGSNILNKTNTITITHAMNTKAFPLSLDADYNPDNLKRIALIIGNSNYQALSKLKNPINDAKDIEAVLKKLNFETITITDGKFAEIKQKMQAFTDAADKNTVAMVFYSGHGFQINGQNYIIPIDADITDTTEIEQKAINVDSLLNLIQDAYINIIVLDACRNNPFKGFKATPSGFKGINASALFASTLVTFATQPGGFALDGAGNNSPYTAVLKEQLKKPCQNIWQVFNNTALEVQENTAKRGYIQSPYITHSPLKNFYLDCDGAEVVENGETSGNSDTNPIIEPAIKNIETNDNFDINFNQVSETKKRKLVDILLTCNSLNDNTKITSVVNMIENSSLKNAISYSNNNKFYIYNIVDTSLNYDNGLKDFIDKVEFVEGESNCIKDIKKLLQQ